MLNKIYGVALALFLLTACSTPFGPPPLPTPSLLKPSAEADACANLPPVYHPARLKRQSPSCINYQGVILADLSEKDGDRHLWIAPDLGYLSYLNELNVYHNQKALVAEIVPACTKEPASEEAAAQCPKSSIEPPAEGAHVEVTGAYVLDTAHGWLEVHPVAKIKILPAFTPTPSPTP